MIAPNSSVSAKKTYSRRYNYGKIASNAHDLWQRACYHSYLDLIQVCRLGVKLIAEKGSATPKSVKGKKKSLRPNSSESTVRKLGPDDNMMDPS
jgi:hypothetical protein